MHGPATHPQLAIRSNPERSAVPALSASLQAQILSFGLAAGAASCRWADLPDTWRRAGELRLMMIEVGALKGLDYRMVLQNRPDPQDRWARLIALVWRRPDRASRLLDGWLAREIPRLDAHISATWSNDGGAFELPDDADRETIDQRERIRSVLIDRMEARLEDLKQLRRAKSRLNAGDLGLPDMTGWVKHGRWNESGQAELWLGLAVLGFETLIQAPCPLPMIGNGYDLVVAANSSRRFAEKLMACRVRVDSFLAAERKGSMAGKLIQMVLGRPGTSADDLSLMTGLSVQAVNQAVKRLVEAEIFRNVGLKAHPLWDLAI